jgi:DNA-binding IscR family transcriptional regulator
MVSATSNPDLTDTQVLEIRRARESLAQALNEVIAKDNLFKGSRFAGIYLDPLTYEWLKKNPKNEDLKRLNRLLLEQAYPTCLAPTHVSRLRSILEGLAAPFLILLTAFVLFYKFMPYAEVNWRSALVGGGVGAFLWQTNISFSVIYISKVVSDSRIYSGFGMLPLFLLGLYISWLIVLLGAQVTCTFQNRLVLFQQQKIHALPQREKEFVALWIMSQIAARFAQGATPPTEIELAGELDLSVNSLDPILKRLKEEGILIEVARKSPSFAPGRPLENISCLEVLECMRSLANEQPFDPEDLKGHSEESTRLLTGLRHTFGEIQGAEREVAEGISVRDLLKQSPVVPETS